MIAIYARVSTEKQKDNYSLPVQRAKGIAFAESLGEDYVVYEEVKSGATLIVRTELDSVSRQSNSDTFHFFLSDSII
jgi:DNA invertase Pin-like site-specific DNA recombinase